MGGPTVLLGSIYHESTTFTTGRTDRENFRNSGEHFGEAIPENLAGTNTEVGGIVDAAEAESVELLYTVLAEAEPGGPVSEEAFRFYVNYIVEAVRENRDCIDGIVLPLHGGMVVEGLDDGEGPLVTAVREVVGEKVPIVVAHDLHANVTDELVSGADALVARETNPHVDMAVNGRRGLNLLLDVIHGDVDPAVHVERPPVVPCGPTMTTREPSMADVLAVAREREAAVADLLKVNVCPGFYGADVPSMGFSVSAVSDGDPEVARRAARRVSERVWDERHGFVEEFVGPTEGVRRARRRAAEMGDEGPVVVAEMNDNPGGGAPADGTPVLRELLDSGVMNWGFAILRDPEAVAACVEAGVGERVTATLGGKTEDEALHGAPIQDVDGYVRAITDGRYPNTGPMRTGAANNLGRAVLFQCGAGDGVAVILTENRVQPLDAEIWRHVGIPPERLDGIVVKSAVHYRADYEPLASHVVPVNGPGVASMDPREFDYSRIPRPQFPLDDVDDDAYPDWDRR